MKKGIGLFALASTYLLASVSAYAANLPGTITITPGVGYYVFSHKRNLENTGLGNISLAYNFDSNWAIEAMYAAFNTQRKDIPNYLPQRTNGNLYTLDGIYRFDRYDMLQPYVDAGLGVLYINRSGNNANTMANINAGVGAQLFFDKHVALRVEVRDLYTLTRGFNDVMFNFGVSILFGGENPEPAPQYKDLAYKNDK